MAIKYSPAETVLLTLLPKGGERITVKELAEKYYKKQKREMPFHGTVFIANALRNLKRKMIKNREKTKLKSAHKEGPPKVGRQEVEFWRE